MQGTLKYLVYSLQSVAPSIKIFKFVANILVLCTENYVTEKLDYLAFHLSFFSNNILILS